jgi:hypothetical protein
MSVRCMSDVSDRPPKAKGGELSMGGKPLRTKAEMKSGGYPENFERTREVSAIIDPKTIPRPGTYKVNVVHEGPGGAVSNSVYLVVKFK